MSGAPDTPRSPGSTASPVAVEAFAIPAGRDAEQFSVHLPVFEGPFDLLLALIAKHRLDITEVALSQVTEEFIAFVRGRGPDWDLGKTTEFLVVAATLLDLKAARLLPSGRVEDEEDVALLEARDLIFARLLQYRAFRQVAADFAERLAVEALRFPRSVGLEERYQRLLPEVVVGIGAAQLARLAARALAPRPAPPSVSLEHLHAPRVSVREQAGLVAARLRAGDALTFAELAADSPTTTHVVARFLALLELFRDGVVTFDQPAPLEQLLVRWCAPGVDSPNGRSLPAERDGRRLVSAANEPSWA